MHKINYLHILIPNTLISVLTCRVLFTISHINPCTFHDNTLAFLRMMTNLHSLPQKISFTKFIVILSVFSISHSSIFHNNSAYFNYSTDLRVVSSELLNFHFSIYKHRAIAIFPRISIKALSAQCGANIWENKHLAQFVKPPKYWNNETLTIMSLEE